ncbi:hypothetical protein JL720_14307 [Aureococcus anophagefferens]|nr:hypothetical protein JL720_14307 [Aureococcus anophagefferens]
MLEGGPSSTSARSTTGSGPWPAASSSAAARVLRRDGSGAASRWAWRPGPEDRWVVPTALLAARDPGPSTRRRTRSSRAGVRAVPVLREDLAPVLRQTSKPGDASPGLSLWRQLASYGAWCPGCRRGFAMRDAVARRRRRRGNLRTPGRRRGPGDADRAPARWREALALEAAADARRRDAQAAARRARRGSARRFVLCDANAESAVVAEFKAAVLAWTAALLERAAASPGAPDWKGLLGAAGAFGDSVAASSGGKE